MQPQEHKFNTLPEHPIPFPQNPKSKKKIAGRFPFSSKTVITQKDNKSTTNNVQRGRKPIGQNRQKLAETTLPRLQTGGYFHIIHCSKQVCHTDSRKTTNHKLTKTQHSLEQNNSLST